MKKKILLVVLAVLVLIQFIRPGRNTSSVKSPNDISKSFAVPPNVDAILKRSCNDCHTNNTVYPWYTNIQPVGWWMQFHVNDGKAHLNFSEFDTLAPKRQHHKMEETIEMVKEGEMPLNSYLWVHKDADLSEADKNILITWADGIMKEIAVKNNLPAEEKK